MRLGVNVDHIATVRQARRGPLPDPVEAALVCERAGAASIVCHLREDRRHIQDADVRRLKQALTVPLNLEMAVARDIVEVALDVKPAQVTLVPERRQELTTEGGLNVMRLSKQLRPIIQTFHDHGIAVSVFVNPLEDQLAVAQDLGARIVELHTGEYATAATTATQTRALAQLTATARRGKGLGLTIAAGHGLDYRNVRAVAEIRQIEELNIGFAIIARALAVGLEAAVREMVELLAPQPSHAA